MGRTLIVYIVFDGTLMATGQGERILTGRGPVTAPTDNPTITLRCDL